MDAKRLDQIALKVVGKIDSNVEGCITPDELDAIHSAILAALRSAVEETRREDIETAALEKVDIADSSDEVYNSAINHVCAALERLATKQASEPKEAK